MKGKDILDEVRVLASDPTLSSFGEINQAYEEIATLTSFNFLRNVDEASLKFKSGITVYTIKMHGIRVLESIEVKGKVDLQWTALQEVDHSLFEVKVAEVTDASGAQTTGEPKWFTLIGGPDYTMTVTPSPDQDLDGRIISIQNIPLITAEKEVNFPRGYSKLVLSKLAAGMLLIKQTNKPERVALGTNYMNEARAVFSKVVRDVHENRTKDIDRPVRPVLR